MIYCLTAGGHVCVRGAEVRQWVVAGGTRGPAAQPRGEVGSGHVTRAQCTCTRASAILHLDHAPSSPPWPLQLLDGEGRPASVTLEPGTMVWYESARLPHGRPTRCCVDISNVSVNYY